MLTYRIEHSFKIRSNQHGLTDWIPYDGINVVVPMQMQKFCMGRHQFSFKQEVKLTWLGKLLTKLGLMSHWTASGMRTGWTDAYWKEDA